MHDWTCDDAHTHAKGSFPPLFDDFIIDFAPIFVV